MATSTTARALARVNDRVFCGRPIRNAAAGFVIFMGGFLAEIHYASGQHGFTVGMILSILVAMAGGAMLVGSIVKLQRRSMMHDIILEVSDSALGARELLGWLRDPSKPLRERGMREIARLIQRQS